MLHVYIEISKYLILLLAALYTFCNFRYFLVAEREDKEAYCSLQQKILLLLHGIAFSVLFFQTEELRILYFYLVQLLFLILYPLVLKRVYRNFSALLLNNICFFLVMGLIMLTRLSFVHAAKQFMIITMAALFTLPVPFLVSRTFALPKLRYIFFGLGILLLLSVFLGGSATYGAKMSLSVAGFSFQPSEFVKLSFVLCCAGMLSEATDFRHICLSSLFAAFHVLLLIACKDLGTALLFFTAYIAMLYLATNRVIYAVLGASALCVAGAASYQLFSHVRTRVQAWLDPWSDISDKGYQIAHSLFAIGTGGWAGMGLFAGMPDRIPIVEKDFIFAAISEEMGAVTALCLILTCFGCFLQMILIALYIEPLFYKLTAAGLSVLYLMQVFLTVGGVTKFIPSTGVTLPFVAYGGSSILSSFLLFMLIEGLHLRMMNRSDAELEEAEDDSERAPDEEDYDPENGYDEENL